MRMTNGTRMINGRAYQLAGVDYHEGAKATAKKYRKEGKLVRVVKISFLDSQIWVL